LCNDRHSHLNPTSVRRRIVPRSAEEVASIVRDLSHRGESMSIAGNDNIVGLIEVIGEYRRGAI
jgi:hypothetical protein